MESKASCVQKSTVPAELHPQPIFQDLLSYDGSVNTGSVLLLSRLRTQAACFLPFSEEEALFLVHTSQAWKVLDVTLSRLIEPRSFSSGKHCAGQI